MPEDIQEIPLDIAEEVQDIAEEIKADEQPQIEVTEPLNLRQRGVHGEVWTKAQASPGRKRHE